MLRQLLAGFRWIFRQTLPTKRAADNLDIHWTPQYWTSLPCDSNYTLIGNFDHLEDDIAKTIDILGLNTSIPHKNASKKKKDETLGYWYNQLPEEHRLALQTMYKHDFDIFGFDDTIPT